MRYQLPQYISKDKIFIVNKSEIESRLDPHYNQPLYVELWNKLLSIPAKVTTIKESSISIFSGTTPKSGGDAYVDNQGIPFIRSGDFSETNEIDFSRLLCIKENIHNTLMANSKLQNGDLLIAIVGATIGKVGVYQYSNEANINQAICAVRLKKSLNPYYVQAFLQTDIGQNIIARIKRPVARANINLEEIGSFPIPLLGSHKQHMIVDTMEFGRKQKLAKEVEAQQLLDSIDDYLLKELGITIPNVDNGLNNRIFFSSFSKIEGNRIDPKKYSTKVRNLCTAIQNANYETKELNRFIVDSCSGDWGTEDCEDYNRNTHIRCLTLRGTEIDNQYNISINKDKAKTRLIKIDTYRKMSIAAGDIIVEKSGGSEEQPVGRVAFIDNELLELYNIGFSNFLFKFKVKDIDPLYLYFYLKTMYNIGVTDSMQSQTNGIRNLIVKEFLSQIVVKPPYLKQQEIVDYINNIRTRAKALQAEGKAILEDAKRKVEEMIIGE